MLHFIKLRKIWYIISVLIVVPGLISLMLQGLNLGIDFTGGSTMEIRFTKDVDIQSVREVVEGMDFEGSKKVQQSENNSYIINTQELTQEESDALINTLTTSLGENTLLTNEMVGPSMGKELQFKAILALLIAAILMIIYITIRFEFKQGLATVIALLHDVFVVVGIFSIFQIEVDSTFVAAILTIVGYSINGSIIIFDRVRENLRMRRKDEVLADLVNKSIWQTLIRSINTVLVVTFVLLALFLMGGITIKVFVLAMLIGVICGFYSSTFVAGSIWIDLKSLEKKKSLQAKNA